MKEINKKIAALALAGFMMGTTGGCENKNSVDPIEYAVNVENDNRTIGCVEGDATLEQLENYYIVEVEDFEGQQKFYLCYMIEEKPTPTTHRHYNYYISGSELLLTSFDALNKIYKCNYGNVIDAVHFIQYVKKYSTIKEKYKFNEIEDIYSKIEEKNKNTNVKKYTLK